MSAFVKAKLDGQRWWILVPVKFLQVVLYTTRASDHIIDNLGYW